MIFVLDTNVLSELMRLAPDERVGAWLDGQDERSLFTTTVSQAEILTGPRPAPDAQRSGSARSGASAARPSARNSAPPASEARRVCTRSSSATARPCSSAAPAGIR